MPRPERIIPCDPKFLGHDFVVPMGRAAFPLRGKRLQERKRWKTNA
jgi:hypothetical protein